MCIAAAMKVLEVDNEKNTARVSTGGNELVVNTSLIFPKVGDYVLVHAGCALEIVQKETADEITELYSMLEELAGNES